MDRRDKIKLNYEHLHMYTFEVRRDSNIEFIVNVDMDQTIKAVFLAYVENDNAYTETKYQPGEEIRLTVTEDRRQLMANEVFYHSTGLEFSARKGRHYYFRFAQSGRSKLISMGLEHYVSLGATGHALTQAHIG